MAQARDDCSRCYWSAPVTFWAVVAAAFALLRAPFAVALVLLAAAQQDDGPDGSGEQLRLSFVDRAKRPGAFYVADHDGERFVRPALAPAQVAHGMLIRCVAGKMEATEPLDGDDAAGCQHLDAAFDDGIALLACGAHSGGDSVAPFPRIGACLDLFTPSDVRAAGEARIGLRMEAPVGGVGVFCRACGAHGECIH